MFLVCFLNPEINSCIVNSFLHFYLKGLFWTYALCLTKFIFLCWCTCRKVKQVWTEDQEMELRRLFEEHSTIEEGGRAIYKYILLYSVNFMLHLLWFQQVLAIAFYFIFVLHGLLFVDVLDYIMKDMSDSSKTRLQVIYELKKQGLIESVKDLKRHKGWVTYLKNKINVQLPCVILRELKLVCLSKQMVIISLIRILSTGVIFAGTCILYSSSLL